MTNAHGWTAPGYLSPADWQVSQLNLTVSGLLVALTRQGYYFSDQATLDTWVGAADAAGYATVFTTTPPMAYTQGPPSSSPYYPTPALLAAMESEAISNTAAAWAAAEAAEASADGLGSWQANTAYLTGDVRRAPDGSSMQRNANGTSRPTFDSTEAALWTATVVETGTVDQVALDAKYLPGGTAGLASAASVIGEASTARAAELALRDLSDTTFKGNLSGTYDALTPGLVPVVAGKLRGGNIVPRPGGYGWQGMFAEWDWNNWIKPQIDRAVALGLNSIRVIGAPRCTLVDPHTGTIAKITQTQYNANWKQLADYCLSKGLYLYPCLVQKWDFVDVYGTAPNWQDATLTASIKSTATLLAGYRNVIGFDLFQEGDSATGVAWAASTTYTVGQIVNHDSGKSYIVTTGGVSASSGGPTGTGTGITDGTVVWNYQSGCLLPADVLAMMSAVRSVSTKPLTMSRSLSDGFGWYDTTSMWDAVFSAVTGSDFVDIHVYADGVTPRLPDFAIKRYAKPLMFGEFGDSSDQSTTLRAARYTAMATIHNRANILGSFLWALADQDTVATNMWGVWDNTGFTPGSAPLSLTSGQRTDMTNVLPTFTVGPQATRYESPSLLTPAQSNPIDTTSGWTTGANTYLSPTDFGLAVAATAAGNTLASTRASGFAVTALKPYRLTLDVLASATASPRTITAQIDWYDNTGTYISSSPAVTGTDSTTAPLTLSLIATAATGAVDARVTVRTFNVLINEAHLFTNVHIRAYNEGATPSAGYPVSDIPSLMPFQGRAPSGAVAVNLDRGSVAITASLGLLTSGTPRLSSLGLSKPTRVSALNFVTGTTAAVTPTHSWAAILDSTGKVVAVSADLTTTAIPASTLMSYSFASPVVLPAGTYYAALCVVAGTVPTLAGLGSTIFAAVSIPPITDGNSSSTGQTTPPGLAATLGTPSSQSASAPFFWLT